VIDVIQPCTVRWRYDGEEIDPVPPHDQPWHVCMEDDARHAGKHVCRCCSRLPNPPIEIGPFGIGAGGPAGSAGVDPPVGRPSADRHPLVGDRPNQTEE